MFLLLIVMGLVFGLIKWATGRDEAPDRPPTVRYVTYKQLVAPRTYDFDPFEEGPFSRVDGVVSCGGGQTHTA